MQNWLEIRANCSFGTFVLGLSVYLNVVCFDNIKKIFIFGPLTASCHFFSWGKVRGHSQKWMQNWCKTPKLDILEDFFTYFFSFFINHICSEKFQIFYKFYATFFFYTKKWYLFYFFIVYFFGIKKAVIKSCFKKTV